MSDKTEVTPSGESVLRHTGAAPFRRPEQSPINFYAVIPIHTAELMHKLEQGLDALLDRFEEAGVSEYIDPRRPSVV